jgi:hypothetical protein
MLSFPSSPNIGDIYSHGFRSWRWDGAVWKSRATTELGTLAFQNAESVDIKGGTISNVVLSDAVVTSITLENVTFDAGTF